MEAVGARCGRQQAPGPADCAFLRSFCRYDASSAKFPPRRRFGARVPSDSPTLHIGAVDAPTEPGGSALLVHGGAWDIPQDETEAHEEGMLLATKAGRSVLVAGGSALDAVVAAVAVMEEHPAFDAGRGAVLNADGAVELDAGIMDGATKSVGAVLGVRHYMYPVKIARAIVDVSRDDFKMLAGAGAEEFAASMGLQACTNESLIVDRERTRYETIAARRAAKGHHSSFAFLPGSTSAGPPPAYDDTQPPFPRGTVGCVARDSRGNVAAATSTGGTPFKVAGRVGDCPLPGAGYFASDGAACSATGWGEAIMTTLSSAQAVRRAASEDHAAAGSSGVARACSETVLELHRSVVNPRGQGATGGIIVMTASGAAGFAFTTPRMARGGWTEGAGDPWVELDDPDQRRSWRR